LQPPQFELLFCTSTHWPPQIRKPSGHWHFPAWQVIPPPQDVPQPPQFVLLVCRSTHVPLQLVSPPAHWQTPFAQVPLQGL
jgi:hypothetical protein